METFDILKCPTTGQAIEETLLPSTRFDPTHAAAQTSTQTKT